MKTIFGFEWPVAAYPELIIAFLVIVIGAAFYILLRYNTYLQKKKIQSQQLFLFKTKQMGLSNYQVKIVNSMADTLSLGDPGSILTDAILYESAIGKFLGYLKEKNESQETLSSICRDIIITYEKLYHGEQYKNPLEKFADIELQRLLYIITTEGPSFIGKIIALDPGTLTLKIFRNLKDILKTHQDLPVKAYLWRAGDAEYTFQSKIIDARNDTVIVEMPASFSRGKEVRLPYIDVIVPCMIHEKTPEESEDDEIIKQEFNAVIYKMHEGELIMRLSRKLDYQKTYVIHYTLSDFKMRIEAKIIAERNVQEENVYYFTFRFTSISDAAKNILKRYIASQRG